MSARIPSSTLQRLLSTKYRDPAVVLRHQVLHLQVSPARAVLCRRQHAVQSSALVLRARPRFSFYSGATHFECCLLKADGAIIVLSGRIRRICLCVAALSWRRLVRRRSPFSDAVCSRRSSQSPLSCWCSEGWTWSVAVGHMPRPMLHGFSECDG